MSAITGLVARPENIVTQVVVVVVLGGGGMGGTIVTQGIYRQNGNMATIQGLK